MVKRKCPKCNEIFDRKYCYDRHLNRKFDCSPNSIHLNDSNEDKSIQVIELNDSKSEICQNLPKFAKICQTQKIVQKNDEIILENQIFSNNPNISGELNNLNFDFSCSYCNKKYSSKYTLLRHMTDVCKMKKENDIEKENIFKLLLEKDKENKENKERIDKLEKQNKLLMDKIDKLINMKKQSNQSNQSKQINNLTNSNNNISNSNNNIQNNFVMVNFGKEDLSIIDEKLFIDRIIKKNTISGVKIPDEVLKIIHFNPMYPQLSNIYISDINREKCMVWEDGEWILSNIDNMPQIIDKICIFSSEQINVLREKFPNSKALNDRLNVIEKYNNMIDDDYIQDLREQDDYNANKSLIKRAEDFQKLAYNTIKKTLYNEGKKLLNYH